MFVAVVVLQWRDKHGLFGAGVSGVTGDLLSAEPVVLSDREVGWEAEVQ